MSTGEEEDNPPSDLDEALISAAERGSVKEVQELLKKAEVNVDCQNEDDMTPLMIASREGHAEVVQLLLSYNADPNLSGILDVNTPLIIASREGHAEVVQLLLKYNADPNPSELDILMERMTPLHVASSNGHIEVVQLLLQYGADAIAIDGSEDELTPLHEASRNGHTKIVQLFLENGTDPNISNEHGKTPLHVADNEDVAKCLIGHGANISALTKDGNSVLHTAACANHRDHEDGITSALISFFVNKSGLSLDALNTSGETPIHMAFNGEVVKCLIELGANVNELTTDVGNSVLHSACKHGHSPAIIYFIKEAGFSLDAINKINETPIDILKTRSNDDYDDENPFRGCLRQLIAEGYYTGAFYMEHADDETIALKKMKGKILKKLMDSSSTLGTKPSGIIYVFASEGAVVDLTTITSTFEKDLEFAVYAVEDISRSELATLFKAAATLHYPVHCKHRCFYFTGHGGVHNKRPFLKSNDKDDKKPLFIREDVLVYFETKKPQPDDSFIFLFDCILIQSANYRGKALERAWYSVEAPSQSVVAHAISVSGTKLLKMDRGRWTSTLCEHLKEQVELGEALAKTHDTVMKLSDGRQSSQFTSRIGPVYLKSAPSEKSQLETRIGEETKVKSALQREMEQKIIDITKQLENKNKIIEQKDRLLSQLTLATAEKDLAYKRLKEDEAAKLDDKEREFHNTEQCLTDELKALKKIATDHEKTNKSLRKEKDMLSQDLQDMKDMACRLKVNDLYDVMLSTANIQDQWEELGRVLCVPSRELERIKSMNCSLSRSHYETLRYWIMCVGASWKGLVDSLKHKDICQKDLADKIDGDYAKISQQRKRLMVVVKDRKLIKKYDEIVPKYDIFSSVDWKVLGMILGLDDDTLEQIDTSIDGNKAPVMVDKWISAGQSYWSVLVDALESEIFDETGSDELAKQIAKDEMGIIEMQARGDDDGNLIEGTYEINETMVEEMKEKILKKLNNASKTMTPLQPKGIIYAVVMTEVQGARDDLANITNTFEKELNYAVYPVEDISGSELANLIKAAATFEYSKHSITCKHKCFYFAGHGGVKDKRPFLKLVAGKEGGERFFIRENILVHFGKKKCHPKERFIFFFDCCLSQSADDNETPAEVGFSLEAPVRCLIAYATAVGVKAYGDKEKGGRWTSTLCERLKEQVELGEVLSKTHDEVMKLSNDTQPPQHRSCAGPVYLKGMPVKQVSAQTTEEQSSKSILSRHRSSLFETLHNNSTDFISLATALGMDKIIDPVLEGEVSRSQGKKEVVSKFLDKLEKRTSDYPTCWPNVINRMAHFKDLQDIAQELRKEVEEGLEITTDIFQDFNKCKTENEFLKQRLNTLETEKKKQEQAISNLKKNTSLNKWKENLIAMIHELN